MLYSLIFSLPRMTKSLTMMVACCLVRLNESAFLGILLDIHQISHSHPFISSSLAWFPHPLNKTEQMDPRKKMLAIWMSRMKMSM